MTIRQLLAAPGKWPGERQEIVIYGDSFADDSPRKRNRLAAAAFEKKDFGPN